jgi:aminoglycoside N3'-acetyltransferase|tara:strand:- start:1986 stop:2492 length:507 start_codon:yes stop_codon:yes gene_type:complete
MFTNNVLFDERSRLSFHPIYSFAAIGPTAEVTFSNISASSFGEDSVFDHLYQQNVKIVLFNSYADIAFIHYVEQKKGVEYRTLKYFTGETVVNGESKIGTFDFYARDENDQTQFNAKGLFDLLIHSKKMLSSRINNYYPVSQIGSREFCQTLLDELSYNPSFLRIPKQ